MVEDLSIAEKGTVGKRVARNTGLMVGAKAAAAVIGLVSLILATRTLPIADVGILLFLHAYMLLFAEVATFQSWQAMIKYGTPDVEAKDSSQFVELTRFCVALDFVGAVAAFILAVLGLLFLGHVLPLLPVFSGEMQAQSVDKIVKLGIPYCTLILVHQGGASTGLLRVFDKFMPLAVQTLVMPLFRLIGVLIAITLGVGLIGFVGAWFAGSFIAYVALPLFAMFELRQRGLLRRVFSKWPNLVAPRKGMWGFVWKANIDSSLATGTTHLPVLIVMPIFGAAFVGAYKVADDIAKLLSEGYLLLDRVIYPEYARMMTRGEGNAIWRLVVKTGAMMLLVGLILALFPAFLGPTVIPMAFGPGYENAVPLAVLLVIAAAFMGVAAPLYPVFYAAGHPGHAIFARFFGLVIYIGLVVVLSNTLGKTGPGWAAIIGNLFAVLLAIILAKNMLGTYVVPKGQSK